VRRALGAGVAAALLAVVASEVAAAPSPGQAVFDANCALCHQAGGVGAPGMFPRLAGRAGPLARTPEGRRLMILAALYGMSGTIQADHAPVVGVMPGFGGLSDAEVAAALDYVVQLGAGEGAKRFTAAEVSAARAQTLTPGEVNALANAASIRAAAP
jgi:mono/diheme cytochrome c family protein